MPAGLEATKMLESAREEDFVEYFLFPRIENNHQNPEQIKEYLQNVLQQVNTVADSISREYIWHKDPFCLTTRINTENEILLNDENNEFTEKLPPHLYGISFYGENIQDEWFMVYLIFEITKRVTEIIGKIIDSDGEFLLIEAADLLPNWANPDTCEGRVFIYNGKIQLVQNSPSNSTSILPVTTATSKIWSSPTLYQVSDDIQNVVEERFKDFKDSFNNLFHHQIVKVSIGVAALLEKDPSLIASSIRTFCDRDSLDLKACKAMRFFPPENRVRISVKFTKCLYAMLISNQSNNIPDKRIGWQLPPSGTEEYKEDLLGSQISSGFEILASQAKSQSNKNEVENDSNWKVYLKNLKSKGYFKDYIENSQDYTKLLYNAKLYFIENKERFNTRPNVGKKILNMLNSVDEETMEKLKTENVMGSSDSDDWLNISPDELNEMLMKKYGIKKLYSENGNVDAKEFTENIEKFLNNHSGVDGVDATLKDEQRTSKKITKKTEPSASTVSQPVQDPNQINFDPDAFSTHIKSFLDFVIPEDNWESNSEMSDYEDEDDLDKNLEDITNDNAKINLESYFKNYTEQMDKELAKTNVRKSLNCSKEENDNDDFDDIESFKPIDINVNTLKSMMDSYKTQIGGTGPVSTLLNAMGVGIEKQDEKQSKAENLTESEV